MNPVTARLLSQQLICPQFTKPEEVVSWFGAMQGQEYRMVRWAVAMRTKSPSLKALERTRSTRGGLSGHICFAALGNWLRVRILAGFFCPFAGRKPCPAFEAG